MIDTVLVTGAHGFIGRETCRALAERKIPVRGTVRNLPCPKFSASQLLSSSSEQPQEGLSAGLETCAVGDVGPSTNWSKVLAGITVVVHLAAHVHVTNQASASAVAEFHRVNALGTEQLARSAAIADVKRLIYISSVGVNGRSTGDHPFTESDAPHPQDAYALSKWSAEKKLRRIARESGLEIVILRPPIVYGPGEPGNFTRLVRLVDRGLPLPFGAIQARRSLIYVGNMANAILACAWHPAASGQTFLLSDGEDVDTRELILRIADALGRRARLISLPLAGLRASGQLLGRSKQVSSLLSSLVVDSSRIRRDLAWTPPYSLADGLRETADRYLERKGLRSSDKCARERQSGAGTRRFGRP
ncbi:MAG: NAD-dependent epimerase/dehydratase family protein [Terriglobales bacterium]